MTVATDSPTRMVSLIRAVLRTLATSPIALWLAVVLVHLVLGLINLYDRHLPLGDVTIVYRFWMEQAVTRDFWVGIDSVWVYPIVAILPMLLAYSFGPELYASTWLSMVMILNVIAFGVLTRGALRDPGSARERLLAGWWWVAFLAALGPIALARIDAVSVPLALVGMLLLATRPRIAALVLTIATWVKVWPAALLAAIVVTSRHRIAVVLTAVATSSAIVATTLALGSGSNVLSFVTQQTGRGLQVEAPVSTIWLWRAWAGEAGAGVYYDRAILTYQVVGDGADGASALMTPLMGVAALVVAALGALAIRRGTRAVDVLPVLSLALVGTLIVFNKVGSPQFISWLAVPVIIGLVASAGGARSFRTPAALSLAIAALTHVVYPYLYGFLLGLAPAMLVVITTRNVLLVVLLGWAVRELWVVASGRGVASGTGAASRTVASDDSPVAE